MLFKIKQTLQNSLIGPVVCVAVFLLALVLFFITENFLFPLAVVVPLVLLSLVSDYRIVFSLLIFSLPLSANFRIESIKLTIGLPSEPLVGLLVFITLIFIFIQDKNSGILTHPITRILYLYWFTLFLSVVFSS